MPRGDKFHSLGENDTTTENGDGSNREAVISCLLLWKQTESSTGSHVKSPFATSEADPGAPHLLAILLP